MSVLRRLTLLTLPFFATACGAEATVDKTTQNAEAQQVVAGQAANSYDEAALKARFSKLNIEIDSIKPAPFSGMVEIQTSGGVLFAANDGSHFITGTLFSLDKEGNYKDVIAARQAPINAAKIAEFKDSMIEYKAENEKYAVTVFTDITCGYCVRLHSQMEDYTDRGITIRYLAFPRNGATGGAADQLARVWCSADPAEGMHEAKIERKTPTPVKDLAQCNTTVQNHYNLGRELGISGTPSLFLPNGEKVGGYLPADALLERLEQTQ